MLTTIEPAAARALATELLCGDKDRLHHVAAVADAAGRACLSVQQEDRSLLLTAAWLHDIGYAPAARQTGFHQLDGARYLRSMGVDDRVCGLVAHHTASHVEASFRGLGDELGSEFAHEDSDVSDALTYADMVTGPTGRTLTVEDRLVEILRRYGQDHVVHRSISTAAGELLTTVRRVEARLLTAQPR